MYQRKNGTWCDTLPQGKGKPPKFFYGKTKAEVKQKMAEWSEKQETGLTVSEALEMWYREHESDLTYNSKQTYKAPMDKINACLGNMPVKDVNPADIKLMLDKLEKQGYSHSVIHIPYTILNMLFDWLIANPNNNIKFNPCSAVAATKVKAKVRDLPSAEVIQTIKNSTDASFGLYPFLLVYTGLRKGEALALTDGDFDFSNNTITITKSLYWVHNRPQVKEPKTKSGFRTIPLLKPLKEILPAWKGYLFSSDGGKSPLTQSEYQYRWMDYCRNTGLAKAENETHYSGHKYTKYSFAVCPHQLRHEFCTICFDAGLDSMDTAELMGHANDMITRQVYTHIKDSRRERTFSKLAEYVEMT